MEVTYIDRSSEMDVGSERYAPSEIAPDRGDIDKPLRLKTWEIDDSFKCPVVGWCLDMGEQREILRKEGICVKGKSDFEAHTRLVGSLQGENHISRRLDLWFNRKYRKELKDLSGLRGGEFLRHWEAWFDRGEVEGILWVAVTKPDLSIEARERIFGDVHMEMHVRAAEIGKERQKLDKERERREVLSTKLKEANRRNKGITRTNERLQKELTEKGRLYDALERKSCELEEELSRLSKESTVSSLERKNKALEEEGEKYSKQISNFQIKLTRLQDHNRKLLSKLKKQRQLNSFLLKDLEKRMDQLSGSRRGEEKFPLLNISQVRILIVGGLPKMEFLYRRLIEESGAMFEYHNGHMSGGTKGLEHQIRRADVVLCPVDHNSHAAALAVKTLGKKHGKPFRMLSNSSLSAISETVLEIQDRLGSHQANWE
jgi:hypothetical protein